MTKRNEHLEMQVIETAVQRKFRFVADEKIMDSLNIQDSNTFLSHKLKQ